MARKNDGLLKDKQGHFLNLHPLQSFDYHLIT